MPQFELIHADCREVMAMMADDSVDSVVTDPPYHLTSIVKRFGGANAAPAQFGTDGAFARASKGFMGQVWDGGDIAFDPSLWAEVLRVLKPGGHIVAFSGTRTYHRMVCAIEDAGFEIRDQLAWVFGSGFPKSLDVSKAIDKAAGRAGVVHYSGPNHLNEVYGAGMGGGQTTAPYEPATDEARQWQGWGTALKPAYEPIVLARKPLIGTVAANILTHGTGALNIDGCRIEGDDVAGERFRHGGGIAGNGTSYEMPDSKNAIPPGRWPANLCHDGSDEVLAGFPDTKSGKMKAGTVRAAQDAPGSVAYGTFGGPATDSDRLGDSGSAARFYYCAKASKADRDEGLYNHVLISLEGESWENVDLKVTLRVDTEQSRLRVTGVSGAPTNNVSSWNIGLFGSESGAPFPTDSISTIATEINSTIESIIWKCFQRLGISGSTADASFATESGKSPAENVADGLPRGIITNEKMGFPHGVAPAAFRTLSKISVSEGRSTHPTVKPTALMQWLVRLITPPGGTVFDPFAGSGSTGKAALLEGMRFIGAEMTDEYIPIATARITSALDPAVRRRYVNGQEVKR